jgi:hypothetical protein
LLAGLDRFGVFQQAQQTGVLFIITQQLQPAFIMAAMQSQQAWIISAHLASPEVQVMAQPSLVMSHLHMPMVRLQLWTTMPFIRQQQLTMPPAIMVQRFCIMEQATGSSQEQVIFIPPVTFSIFMVQRGTIMKLGIAGAADGAPVPGIPGIVMLVRSIIMVFVMGYTPCKGEETSGSPHQLPARTVIRPAKRFFRLAPHKTPNNRIGIRLFFSASRLQCSRMTY